MLPDVLLASTQTWTKLTPEEQGWLKEAVENSVVYQRKLWLEAEDEALEAVKKAGVEIIRPNKSLFADKIKDSFEKYKEDETLFDLIQKIQATE